MNMEALNLLITLNRLIGYKLTIEQIKSLFGINCNMEESYSKLNYFQICTLLYLIEKDNYYQPIKDIIEKEIIRRFPEQQVLKKSENAHLFFDIMTCPYVEKSVGMNIIRKATGVSESQAYKKRSKLAKPKRWFFDWDKNHALAYFLSKKEYHSPYE